MPEDFPLSSLANDAERRVVEAFRDGLSDGWLIVPDLALRGHRDYQLDLVLLHESWGIVDIEVKGHRRIEVRDGLWYGHGRVLEPQPLEQAKSNAYKLRDKLRDVGASLGRIDVEYAVALPNATAITGDLPPGIDACQVLTQRELDDPQEALELLLNTRWHTVLARRAIETVVATLRPDADFSFDPEANARAARERLDELCASQVAALETLDANPRVYVSGRAGTGKTRLAAGWVRRAVALREERVLFTCYNDPLADAIAERFHADERLVIGAFLRMALALPGIPPLPIPDDADHDWWNTVALDHLHRHWPQVSTRFDTIVIDEGQDFSPDWLALLDTLLDPDGPGRVLMVGDGAQTLYDRGFIAPTPADGWAVAELVRNCRNVHEIGRLLRRHLGGAAAPMVGPTALGVEWLPASDLAAAAAAVNQRLVDLLEIDERDPTSLVVATFTTSVRDALRAELSLVPWEDRGAGAIACENVHRIKGLEADCVLLVSPVAEVSDALLYVGISRAVSQLILIGPAALAARVGLTNH